MRPGSASCDRVVKGWAQRRRCVAEILARRERRSEGIHIHSSLRALTELLRRMHASQAHASGAHASGAHASEIQRPPKHPAFGVAGGGVGDGPDDVASGEPVGSSGSSGSCQGSLDLSDTQSEEQLFASSVLPRLLRSTLTGDAAVCIFLCINPHASAIEAALRTLEFGSLIKDVRTSAKRRQLPVSPRHERR